MGSDVEKKFLIKAIEAFGGRLIVVSPEFKILAAKHEKNRKEHSEIIGKYCYQEFYGHTSPCENCAVDMAIGIGRPALRLKPEETLDLNEMPCYYAYPIFSGKDIEAFVSMDFDLPTRVSGLEEKFRRTNAFLRNLILNAVDGVIAADKKGNILIFNEVAEQWGASGYDQDQDALRVTAVPAAAEHVESMEFEIEGSDVVLRWEKLAVAFEVAAAER